jgi:uncharacterized membrane protein
MVDQLTNVAFYVTLTTVIFELSQIMYYPGFKQITRIFFTLSNLITCIALVTIGMKKRNALVLLPISLGVYNYLYIQDERHKEDKHHPRTWEAMNIFALLLLGYYMKCM